MIPKFLLVVAALLLPATLVAENVMEMRYVLPKEEAGAIKAKFEGETLWLSPEVVVSDADVKEAYETVTTERQAPPMLPRQVWSVTVKFDEAGAARFDAEAVTHYSQRLAIVVKGKLIAAPVIRSKKFGGVAAISGNYTQQEAKDLAKTLQPKEKAKP